MSHLYSLVSSLKSLEMKYCISISVVMHSLVMCLEFLAARDIRHDRTTSFGALESQAEDTTGEL